MKKLTLMIAALALSLFAGACGGPDTAERKIITIKGSDTMLPLGQRWAETYMTEHKEITIQVTGGGSGVGIAALQNGATDICQASRAMKDSEKKRVRERSGKEVKEIPVAL